LAVTTYINVLLYNTAKVMHARREIATKLTQPHKFEAQAGPLQSHDTAMFTSKN
jgi:hypothetical protein